MKKLLIFAWLSLAMGIVLAQQSELEQGAFQEAESALGAVSEGPGIKGLMGNQPKKQNKKTPAQEAITRKAEVQDAHLRMIEVMYKEPKPNFYQMTGLMPGELAFIKQHEEGLKRKLVKKGERPNALLGTVAHAEGELGAAAKEYTTGVKDIERKVGATEAAVFGMKPAAQPEHRANPDMLRNITNRISERPVPGQQGILPRTADAITTNNERIAGVTWKRTSKSSGVPPIAIRGGFHQSAMGHQEQLLSNFICRAQINGAWKVGSLLDNGLCLIQNQDRIYSYEQYQVLQGAAGQLAWKPMLKDTKNLVAEGDDMNTAGICHAVIDQKIPRGIFEEHTRDVIVGHVEDNKCVYGFNGKQQSTSSFEVLTKK